MYDYRPQTKFAKVVSLHLSVSHSVQQGSTCAGTPPLDRYSPRAGTPPGAVHVHAGRDGQQAGGTHPTGMHSCLLYFVACGLVRLFMQS